MRFSNILMPFMAASLAVAAAAPDDISDIVSQATSLASAVVSEATGDASAAVSRATSIASDAVSAANSVVSSAESVASTVCILEIGIRLHDANDRQSSSQALGAARLRLQLGLAVPFLQSRQVLPVLLPQPLREDRALYLQRTALLAWHQLV